MKSLYFSPLTELYELHSNAKAAPIMKKYLLNKFEFFGLKMPHRRSLDKQFYLQNGLPEKHEIVPIVKALWKLPQREYHYFAVELLAKFSKKNPYQPDEIVVLEYLILHNSWWDTVDFIATKLVARYFEKYPEQILPYVTKWIASENIWLQRTAILFQLKYKERTDVKLLFSCIKKMAHSKEFFIRKVIGWTLREYARTDSQKVIDFVNTNSLSPLSKREALKNLVLV